jgi:Tfp pilus assembly protein FimT
MTLVELLVVLGIVGLIVGMSVPALTGYAKTARLKAATRQIMGLLVLARSMAISSHEDHAVVIDRPQGRLSVVNLASGEPLERVVRLPNPITLDMEIGGESSEDTQVVFRPTGALSGRTISLVLADRDRSDTITVTSVTGAVSLK